MQLTKTQIAKLKSSLPKGYFKKLQDATGYSERAVAKFFAGESQNTAIMDAAIQLAEEHKQYLQAQRDRINLL